MEVFIRTGFAVAGSVGGKGGKVLVCQFFDAGSARSRPHWKCETARVSRPIKGRERGRGREKHALDDAVIVRHLPSMRKRIGPAKQKPKERRQRPDPSRRPKDGGSTPLASGKKTHREQVTITPRQLRRIDDRQPTDATFRRDVTQPTLAPRTPVPRRLELAVTSADARVRRRQQGGEPHLNQVGGRGRGRGRGGSSRGSAAEDVGPRRVRGGRGRRDKLEQEVAECKVVSGDAVSPY